MSETPRSPDQPDNTDERPDVAQTDTPDNAQADTVGDPGSPATTPPDVTPMDTEGNTADDAPTDPMADASDEEAAAASQVVLPEYEARITAAANAADADLIAEVQAEYSQARLDKVREADRDE